MKASTIDLLDGLIEAAVKDKGEQAEAKTLIRQKAEKRPDKQLTSKAAAELIGCTPKTLFRWAEQGKLHPRRLSASFVRWSRNEIEDLLCAEG